MGNQKQKVALSSVFAGLFLTIFKLLVGLLTGSMGIISEAIHSALDFLAAIITYFAVWQSEKPADESHHYGHGKIENISAFIETLLLVLTSFWIIYEAFHRLLLKRIEIDVSWYAFAIMFISIIVDFSRSRALFKVAKATNSQALEADALHFSTDIYSSSVVILGLILYLLGLKGADSFAAIVVALFVLLAAYRLGKRTIDDLLDKAPEELVNQIKKLIINVDGVFGIERIRVRKSGSSVYIDAAINVNRTISLENVNKITKRIQNAVQQNIKGSDVVVHVNPVAIKGESIVERIQTIIANHGLFAHDISVYSKGKNLSINFDLEVGASLNLEAAHKKATHIEKSILDEFGKATEVNIHIEPLDSQRTKVEELSDVERKKIMKIIDDVVKDHINNSQIHDVLVHKIKGKYFISLHGNYKRKSSIKEAHLESTKIEEKIKSRNKKIESVNVHVEPL